MAPKVFFSFNYDKDNARVSQIRNIGAVEGQTIVNDNEWEKVWKGGDQAVYNWIDTQLKDRTCTVVLIGAETAGRKFINYEIEQSFKAGKGVFGVHIHNLKDLNQNTVSKGKNPFDDLKYLGIDDKNHPMSEYLKVYDPPFTDSKQVYKHIADNLVKWIDAAIAQRK